MRFGVSRKVQFSDKWVLEFMDLKTEKENLLRQLREVNARLREVEAKLSAQEKDRLETRELNR